MKPEDFDVIGLTLEEAKAKYPSWTFREYTIDGQSQTVTMDFNTYRVNVSTVNDKITLVEGIG